MVAVLCVGCGQRQSASTTPPVGSALHGHPQAVEPVAGAAAPAESGSADSSVVSVGPTNGPLPQPISDAEVRRELAGETARPDVGTLTPSGFAVPPSNAPPLVRQIIQIGNTIARLPYRFGGGHGTFFDSAYDCSGSLSFVFAAVGLLNTTVTSGELMSWGAPGRGRWITVFATPGHTFMYVAGLRFDTVALAETGTRWSNRPADEPDLARFVARHPPGL